MSSKQNHAKRSQRSHKSNAGNYGAFLTDATRKANTASMKKSMRIGPRAKG